MSLPAKTFRPIGALMPARKPSLAANLLTSVAALAFALAFATPARAADTETIANYTGGSSTDGVIADGDTLNVNTIYPGETYDGVLSGSGNLNLLNNNEGFDLVEFTQAQTYTGTTRVGDGHLGQGYLIVGLQADAANLIASSSNVQINDEFIANGYDQSVNDLNGGGIFSMGTGSNSVGPTVGNTNTAASATLTMNIVNGSTWNGIIENDGKNGKVAVTGSGTWQLGNQNLYGGTTSIASGSTVQANTTNVIADSVGVTVEGIFDANGNNQTLNDLAGGGKIYLNNGGTTGSTLTVNLVNGSTWAGVISNGTTGTGKGNLAITGTGTLTVTAAQTYTGTTSIASGSILVAGTTNVIADSSAVTVNGTFDTNARSETLNDLSGSGTITNSDVVGPGTVNANIVAGSEWDGVIKNGLTAKNNLTVTGTGTLILGGANTYTGTTSIASGSIVKATAANVIADSVGVTVTGIFNANGHNQTLGDLTGAGNVYLNDGATTGSTLTENIINGSTWNGVISNGTAGTGKGNFALTGTTTASLIFGVAQTYTGTTNIGSGAYLQAGLTNVIADSNGVTVNGTFESNGHDQTLNDLAGSGAVWLGDGGSSPSTLTVNIVNGSTWNGVISDKGSEASSVDVTGTGLLRLGGANSYTGTTNIGTNAIVVADATNVMADSIGMTVDGIFYTNTHNQSFNDLAGMGSVNLGDSTIGGSTLTMNIVNGSTWSGVISDSGNVGDVAVTGSGTWQLANANTYSGTTNIASGSTVQAGTTNVIADSIGVTVNGTFDAHGYGQTLNDLAGSGAVHLDNTSVYSTLTMHIVDGSTWSGIISDNGSVAGNVSVTGTGTWIVSGANSYTGITNIGSDSIVQANADNVIADSGSVLVDGTFDANGHNQTVHNLIGSGTVLLGDGSSANSTLTMNITGLNTWDGVISDNSTAAGNVDVTGSGLWALTGANTYTGTTTIASGATLVGGAANVIADSVGVTVSGTFDAHGNNQTLNDLTGNGEVQLDNNSMGSTLTMHIVNGSTWSGIISDSGTAAGNVAVTGTGTWIVGAAQTYSGTTNIASGSYLLAASNNVIADSIGVTVNGTFNTNGGAQKLNDLSGSGTVELGDGATGSTLTVNIAGGSTWAGNIVDFGGPGNIIVTNTGTTGHTWIVNSDNTYSGSTEIENGATVQVNGTLSSGEVTVDTGGVLQGNGILNSDLVLNGGTLAPGHSPGTITVNTLSGTGTLQEQLTGSNSAGNFDKTVVLYGAALSGITVDYVPLSGPVFVHNTQYTILTAVGGLGGTTFTNAANGSIITGNEDTDIANSSFPDLKIQTSYTANDVIATVISGGSTLAALGNTPNARNAGNALDQLNGNVATGSPVDVLLDQLGNLSGPQQTYALGQLAGTMNTYLQTSTYQTQRYFDGMVGKRLGGDCNTMSEQQQLSASGSAWGCGYGSLDHIGADANSTGINSTLGGFAAGYEAKLTSANTLRFGVGYSNDSVRQQQVGGASANVNSYQIGAYGQHNIDNSGLYIGSGLSAAYNEGDTKRDILGVGRAKGKPDGYNGAASLLLGYETSMRGIALEPVAAVEYVRIRQNSFTEYGAGGANLSVDSTDSHSLRSSLGLQASTSYQLGNGMVLTPQGRAAYIYDSLDVTPEVNESFAGGTPFTVKGSNPGRSGVQTGGGITLDVDNTLSVFADYTGTFKNNETTNSLMGGVKFKW